ncbi:MAG: NHLP bacteriocin export ABC transporter permease/ATPase subunit [Proteobacteria bacterium]|nr:NHLP bacteriocin export ABC transporter permease/ATPase subunit [Pseudomonadota bacterium]
MAASCGERIEVQANTPFLLKGEDRIWLVQKGKIDVFCVELANGQPAGRRTRVLRAEEGEALFGADLDGRGAGVALLAVGFPGTVALALDRAAIAQLAEAFPRQVEERVEGWVCKLSAGVVKTLSPKNILALSPEAEISLEQGDEARPPRNVIWLKVLEGETAYLGNEHQPIGPDAGIFPLTPKTWVQAVLPCRLRPADTRELLGQATLWEGLAGLHRLALDGLARERRLQEEAEHAQLLKKARIGREAAGGALGRLASLLETEKGRALPAADPDDPLLTACQWVGEAQGIRIRKSAKARAGTGGMDKNRMEDIARASRTRVRQVVLSGRWWRQDNGPILAHYEDSRQPVALLPVSSKRYEIADPASPKRRPVTPELARKLSPFAYVFYRSFPAKPLTVTDLLKFGAAGCASDLRMLLLISVLAALLGLIVPVLTKQIFDTIVPESDRIQLVHVIVSLVAAAVVTGLFQVTKSIAQLRLESRMNASVQGAVWDRLLNLPLSFFRDFNAGDLASRAGGINAIRQMISGAAASAMIGGVFSVFYLGILFYYEVKLAFIALGVAAISLVFTGILSSRTLRHQRKITALDGKLSGMVLQFINGISKLRVAGAEIHAFATWSKTFTAKKKEAVTVGAIMNWQETFNAVFPVASSIAIFASVSHFMAKAAAGGGAPLTVGSFLAFNTAFIAFVTTSLDMSLTTMGVLGIIPLYERARPILQALPELDTEKPDPGELKGEIEANHLEFRYREDLPLVLKDVSLHLKPGEFAAVVGASGSGKSTLLRLLLGFEKPESGSLYYDGQNLADIDMVELRRQVGVVLQSSRIMSGDIFRNIIGTAPLTLADAWKAAEMAGFKADIDQMPMKMHTLVSEGASTLSGGQRQRLLIARALVNKPRIIFFDEATSALDNQTQTVVSKSLESLQATRLVIAHRLSTIMNADTIHVMDDGRIVDSGTYEELMKRGGLFADLVKRQLL